MDNDTKSAFAKLTKTVTDGFAAIDTRFAAIDKRFGSLDERMEKSFASLEARMDNGFAAVADDIADIKDRLTGVESKIAGTNRRLDEEAMHRSDLALPKRVSDLEEKTFGASRHPQHIPVK
jgi:hypothetical protein